jgi:hypothetical protein
LEWNRVLKNRMMVGNISMDAYKHPESLTCKKSTCMFKPNPCVSCVSVLMQCNEFVPLKIAGWSETSAWVSTSIPEAFESRSKHVWHMCVRKN